MNFMRTAAAAVSAVFLALASPTALAQTFLPGVAYDPAIPTIESVLGKPSGERITPAADVVRYFRALQKAAPDRIKVTTYAKSWQGRELVYAVIGSPERTSRGLDSFSLDMKALADPRRTSQAAANAIIARTPGSVWLAHGVHGDEISSADASMMTAYHLLAAKDDPTVAGILANTLVFIDPVQNPDGRDRFVNGFYDTTGLVPSGSPIAAERNQPWPGGRFNHYLFDMNRDWLSITQPETTRPHRDLPEMVPAGLRRPARDGLGLVLLLLARSRSLQPRHHAEPARDAETDRAQQRANGSTGSDSPTSRAKSTTRSIPATAPHGRCSTARSARRMSKPPRAASSPASRTART